MPDISIPARAATVAAPDGVPMPQRIWAILTIALGLTLAVLNGAIANVALPTIAREVQHLSGQFDLGGERFQLAVTISLLPLASLGEIHGYRRDVPGWGLVVFTIASVLCALSSTLPMLIMARVLQGLRRGGHHERQQRADPLHLSAPLARPRRRAERDDRIDRLGASDRRWRPPCWRWGPGRGCSR